MKAFALFLAPVLALGLALSQLAPRPGAAATDVSLPQPLDEESVLVERYWIWLKAQVGAPADLPWPHIEIEPLPRTVRMAFVFPSEAAPWIQTRVILSPGAIDRAAGPQRLEVIGELAHEIVHYVLVMEENDWVIDAATYKNDVHQHCDPEFMRLNRQISKFIWDTYHSNDAIRSIDHMVQLACWRDGHNLGAAAKR